jgi:uncharacterized protein YpmB
VSRIGGRKEFAMIKRVFISVIVIAVLVVGGLMISKSLKSTASAGQNQYRTAKVATGLVKTTTRRNGTFRWKRAAGSKRAS